MKMAIFDNNQPILPNYDWYNGWNNQFLHDKTNQIPVIGL